MNEVHCCIALGLINVQIAAVDTNSSLSKIVLFYMVFAFRRQGAALDPESPTPS